MIYSRLTARFKKKEVFSVKTLVVCAVLSVLLAGCAYVYRTFRSEGWLTQNAIQEMAIANISPTGFDIAWTDTSSEKDRWVEWGEVKGVYPNKVVPQRKGMVYVVNIGGLSANTKYVFRIRAGTYTLMHKAESYFTVTTPKQIKQRPVSPAYGKVVVASGKPLDGAVLIYSPDSAHPLMTITKPSGEWLIPLSGIVSRKTNEIEIIRDDILTQIHIMGQNGVIARGKVADTRPTSKVLQANLFTRLEKVDPASGVLGASVSGDRNTNMQPQIIYPKEKALIPGNTPLIRGIGVPNKSVNVLIQGPKLQYAYRAQINEKGEWIVQYPLPLEQGQYTISGSTVDRSGFPLTVNRTFTIIKSGEQVLGEATGSPTLAPTSPVPSPTRSVVPTSAVPSPTGVLPTYAMPTLIPTNTTAVVPTAIPTLGGGSYMFGVMAFIFIVLGGIFILAF